MNSKQIIGAFFAAAVLAHGFQAAPPAAPKGTLEGQVVNGATGAPLKRATVRLNGQRLAPVAAPGQGPGRGGGMPSMPNMLNKETDDQGRFVFTGLEAGRYNLSAERTGFLRQSYGARKYSQGGTAIVLGADQNVKDIIFKLTPQSVITGKVLDDEGEPVANVQVRAMKYQYRGGKKQWSQVSNGQTSDIGEYRIPGLDPGSYVVSANPNNRNGGMMQTASNEALPQTPEMVFAATFYPSATDSTSAIPVDLGRGAEMRGIDIRLRKTRVFRIRGTVANVSGGRGQTMVMLTPKDGMQGPQGMSPARPPDNRFEIRGVTPGSYILHTQPNGGNQGNMAYQAVEVTGNHLDGIVLAAAPGTDIPGSIKIEDAAAPIELPNVNVNLRATFPMGNAPRGKAGSDLRFTLKNVMPMHYIVNVSGVPDTCFVKSIRYGGLDVPAEGIDITSSAPIEITLSATAGQIDGAVVDSDGKPVSNATVALFPSDGSPARGNGTDERGIFSFHALKPGDYRVMAFEDIPSGAYQDPQFVKPFEGRAESVKLEARGKGNVQIKVVPAADTDK